jgi:uncharacterized protein with PIN domain
MSFYADEDFDYPAVEELRRLGHDAVTVQEYGQSGANDNEILATALALGRVVLTHNRRHFERLHRAGINHAGIISCTRDHDLVALAARIHGAVSMLQPGRWCLRVNRTR